MVLAGCVSSNAMCGDRSTAVARKGSGTPENRCSQKNDRFVYTTRPRKHLDTCTYNDVSLTPGLYVGSP